MEITSAEFVISNSRADMCPKSDLPEYAFIGRSNVVEPHQHVDQKLKTGDDIIHSG